jgi:hypothetical protein
MKKSYTYILITLFALSIIILPSCKKNTDNKLQGKWKRLLVYDLTSPLVEEWTFSQEGGSIYIYKQKKVDGINHDIKDSGRYYINAKLRRTLIHVEDLKILTDYNGDWQIVTLDKSSMMIVYNTPLNYIDEQNTGGSNILTKGGLLYREFTKE